MLTDNSPLKCPPFLFLLIRIRGRDLDPRVAGRAARAAAVGHIPLEVALEAVKTTDE
jgi:hypothetical protein